MGALQDFSAVSVCVGVLTTLVLGTAAEPWQWPEQAQASAGPIRFLDNTAKRDASAVTSDINKYNKKSDASEKSLVSFIEPQETPGFYNRPPGSGRYPVKVETNQDPYDVNPLGVYPVQSSLEHKSQHSISDDTVDLFQHCKCFAHPECRPDPYSQIACGVGKYLCCKKRPGKTTLRHSEFFNEIDDERPMLFPSQETAGVFPPPGVLEENGRHIGVPMKGLATPTRLDVGPIPNQYYPVKPQRPATHPDNQPVLSGPDGPRGTIRLAKDSTDKIFISVDPDVTTSKGDVGRSARRSVLTGPGGPTGNIGPDQLTTDQEKGDIGNSETAQRGVLFGPGGPTGILGPYNSNSFAQQPVLVGPGGPTGVVGPRYEGQRAVLTGPGGPTGVVGPGLGGQRGVLVGPGGPTGMVGPSYRQSGVLVGPRGPTGIVGPGYGRHRAVLAGPGGPTGLIGPGYGQRGQRGLLVGPGGPTGTIGPGRRLLVGPGGPTGIIGPQR